MGKYMNLEEIHESSASENIHITIAQVKVFFPSFDYYWNHMDDLLTSSYHTVFHLTKGSPYWWMTKVVVV